MCLYANGQSVPSKALQPKFSSNNYVEAFQSLFTGMELDGKDVVVGRPTSSIVPKNIKIGISCYKLVSISI